MARTVLSLLVDDTVPAPLGQLKTLLDFCQSLGARGKVSFIPANGGIASGLTGPGELWQPQAAFLPELRRAPCAGFEVHMELMTHRKLWDFAGNCPLEGAPCEGLWLHDRTVPKSDYLAYFSGILDTAARHGVTLHGLTVPGCGCDDCQHAFAEMEAKGPLDLNPGALSALLDLADAGRFGARSVAIFAEEADTQHAARIVMRLGDCTILDLRPNTAAADRMGYDGLHDPDYYITADGQAGRVVDLVEGGAAYCFLCAHWYAMNPEMPQGWAAFREVLTRIDRHLGDRIEWVTPSSYGDRLARNGKEQRDVPQG